MYYEHSRKWHTCGHSWTPPPCFQGIGLARLRTCSAVQEGTASPPSGYVTAKLTVWTGRMRRDVVSLRRYLGWNMHDGVEKYLGWCRWIFIALYVEIFGSSSIKLYFRCIERWTLQRGVGEIGVSVWFVTFITVFFKEVHWQIKSNKLS